MDSKSDVMLVPGVFNDVADGISRRNKSAIHANLVRARPHNPWQNRELGKKGKYICTSMLASLEFVQNAVAPSTERAYQDHFFSLVEFGLNVICEPVFLYRFVKSVGECDTLLSVRSVYSGKKQITNKTQPVAKTVASYITFFY